MDIEAVVASRIKFYAEKRGYSINHLADFAGVSRGYMSEVLRGKYSPTVRLLARIAEALEVEIVELFRRQEEQPPRRG